MTMLSSKSNEEIKRMLDDYGIKHGPVVDSTRALYEKKLREAMSKHRRTQVQSDRTYYREEEDVTYVQHHRPQLYDDVSNRTWSDYRGMDYTDEPAIYRTQAPYQNMSQARNLPPEPHIQKTPEKTRLVPVWLQILVFLIVSGLLYLVYINTESAEPEKRLT
ncbi:emerin-like [Sinocyclocheilus grahami]|uniref:emerin-like n=1 Tax=Sinocyclocheilus grahami TaxID=75366 RepID=UPI0007AD12C5|nr:PREDICTED: emerin-like [Sinocyclocheilus grahami]